MKKICKGCGKEIDEVEYEEFNGRCVGCDEIQKDIMDETSIEDAEE